MDDGQPTGPAPTWWSRPPTGPAPAARPAPGPDRPSIDPTPAPAEQDGVHDARAPVGPVPSPRPLHDPDPYGTPPYGDPGPWAPAPPVQPPSGAPAPAALTRPPAGAAYGYPAPQATGPHGHAEPQDVLAGSRDAYPAGDPTGGAAHETGQPPLPPAGQHWQIYDPWSAPGSLPGPGEGVRPRRRVPGVLALAAFGVVTAVVGGTVGAYLEQHDDLTATVHLPQAAPEHGDRVPGSVAGIAASALPSVVTIHATGATEAGTGTGFVLDRAGHLLTNNHVITPAGGSGRISVTFSGGQTVRAKVVGRDSGYDLAVLQVSGVSGLRPLPLGNSDSVRVGDPVVAIGAPFDLSNTVTSGIISAKDRAITAADGGGPDGGSGGEPDGGSGGTSGGSGTSGGQSGGGDVSYVDALQTDAPINPGNSGGPLVDTKARVIGINSAIRSADGTGLDGGEPGSIGLGFAIPINQAKRVAEELINTGRATHPVIGVTLDMGYQGDGARIDDRGADGGPAVTARSPAAKAGLRAGDVITAIGKEQVSNGEELIVKVRAHRPGDRVELTLLRGGHRMTVAMTLGSAEGS